MFPGLGLEGFGMSFLLLAIENNDGVNVGVRVFVWICVFNSVVSCAASGLTLRNCQMFSTVGHHFIPHRQCMQAPTSPHPCQRLLSSVLFCWWFFNSHSSMCEVKPH